MRDQALPATAAPPRASPALRRLRAFAAFARRQPSFALGLVIVALTLFLAAFGPLIAPYHPERRAGRRGPAAAVLRPLDGHRRLGHGHLLPGDRGAAHRPHDRARVLARGLRARRGAGRDLGLLLGHSRPRPVHERSDHARRRHPAGLSDLHLRARARGLPGAGHAATWSQRSPSSTSLFPAGHPRLGAAGARASVRGGRALRRQLRAARSPSSTSCRTR